MTRLSRAAAARSRPRARQLTSTNHGGNRACVRCWRRGGDDATADSRNARPLHVRADSLRELLLLVRLAPAAFTTKLRTTPLLSQQPRSSVRMKRWLAAAPCLYRVVQSCNSHSEYGHKTATDRKDKRRARHINHFMALSHPIRDQSLPVSVQIFASSPVMAGSGGAPGDSALFGVFKWTAIGVDSRNGEPVGVRGKAEHVPRRRRVAATRCGPKGDQSIAKRPKSSPRGAFENTRIKKHPQKSACDLIRSLRKWKCRSSDK